MGVNPNIQPEKVHLLSGIVTEHAQMYDNLTGIENLMFYATAFGLEQKGKWRAESLLKELELTEAKDQKTGDLFHRYETEVIYGKGTAAPPESSVS